MSWNVRGYPELTAASREWFNGQPVALAADILMAERMVSDHVPVVGRFEMGQHFRDSKLLLIKGDIGK